LVQESASNGITIKIISGLHFALVPSFRGVWIDRKTKQGGNGSDHDPTWVEMGL
jgi:hypothetical protein